MTRFLLVLATVIAIAALSLLRWHGAALGVGIGAGVVFFLLGAARGGSLGNAREFGRAPADISSRLGVCLAAMGIASGTFGHDPPFPLSFRVFYGFCLAAGAAGALFLAGRGLRK